MPTAFKATYSDWKLIKTRQVVQIVFEVPLAEADDAYEILGGMPNPAHEGWLGIAALTAEARAPQPPAEKERIPWREVQPAAQAGIRCAEPAFRTYLAQRHGVETKTAQEAAEAIRNLCGVNSRSQLGVNHKARTLWHQIDSGYQAWMNVS